MLENIGICGDILICDAERGRGISVSDEESDDLDECRGESGLCAKGIFVSASGIRDIELSFVEDAEVVKTEEGFRITGCNLFERRDGRCGISVIGSI